MSDHPVRVALRRFSAPVEGLCLGLYAARLLAESGPQALRLVLLAPLAMGGAVAGLAVAHALACRRCRLYPLYGLGAYVLWPIASPAAAAALGLAALVGLLAANGWPSWGPGRSGLVAAVLGLALYLPTLAPSLLTADAAEFQLVCAVLGIAHPPGYALYTLVGHAFTWLPLGDAAFRVNLLSAACGAAALGIVAWALRREGAPTWVAVLCAVVLGAGTTFWSVSTTAGIRAPTAALAAAVLSLAWRWGSSRAPRHLAALALIAGLAVGHHASLGLWVPLLAAYVLALEPRLPLQPRRWGGAAATLAASLLVLAYLPLRSLAGAPFDPVPIRSLTGFVEHVLAVGFRGDLLYFASPAELATRIGIWGEIMRLQFGSLLLGLASLAAVAAIVRPRPGRRAAALLALSALAVNALAAVTYRAPQTVEYLLPSYVALVLLLGLGLAALIGEDGASRRQALAATLLAVGAAGLVAANLPSMRALRVEGNARPRAEALLRDAPQGTLLLANWHWATPLQYLQLVEGLRPDVEVQYVYPEGALPNEAVWLRRIGEGLHERRPVIVTNWFHAYRLTDYVWQPCHGAWQVALEPPDAPPAEATVADVELRAPDGGSIAVVGHAVEAGEAVPGGSVALRLYWRVGAPLADDYTAFAQLLGPDGAVVGQSDLAHATSRYAVGGAYADAHHLPLLLHAAPGAYRLVVGFYRAIDGGWERLHASDGRDHLDLGPVVVSPASEVPASLQPTYARWDGGPALVGVDVDRGVSGQTRLYLHFFAPEATPARRVRVEAEGARAEADLPPLQSGQAQTVALDLPGAPSRARLSLLAADGAPVARLGVWHRPVARPLRLRLPAGDVRYVPLGGGVAVVANGLPEGAVAGETVWLRPRLLALRPLAADYSTSLGLARPELGWEVRADGTPALGAIPTLKWARGWEVREARGLNLPEDAPEGEARATLRLYDAFTLATLPVLDERLVREGQGLEVLLGWVGVAGP